MITILKFFTYDKLSYKIFPVIGSINNDNDNDDIVCLDTSKISNLVKPEIIFGQDNLYSDENISPSIKTNKNKQDRMYFITRQGIENIDTNILQIHSTLGIPIIEFIPSSIGISLQKNKFFQVRYFFANYDINVQYDVECSNYIIEIINYGYFSNILKDVFYNLKLKLLDLDIILDIHY
jgi:hypothetical protein